jgi:hypothetical protein
VYSRYDTTSKSYEPINRPRPIDEDIQSIYTINLSLFLLPIFFYRCSSPCPSNSKVWFNFYRFTLKSGRLLSEIEDLCCFARKASVRRHESTTVILVLRGSFVCQHNWRLRWGRSIEWSPARSCYVESVIDRLQSTTVT